MMLPVLLCVATVAGVHAPVADHLRAATAPSGGAGTNMIRTAIDPQTSANAATKETVLVCLTTTPVRLGDDTFRTVIDAYMNQKDAPPYQIALVLPNLFQNSEKYTVPPWINTGAYQSKMKVVRISDDLGPLSKSYGCLVAAEQLSLPAEAVLVVTDDDYVRGEKWLNTFSNVQTGEVRTYEMSGTDKWGHQTPNGGNIGRVRGCVGYSARFGSWGSSVDLLTFFRKLEAAEDAEKAEHECRKVDDIVSTSYLLCRGNQVKVTILSSSDDFYALKGIMQNYGGGLSHDKRRGEFNADCNRVSMEKLNCPDSMKFDQRW
jgi:hypothetical protein